MSQPDQGRLVLPHRLDAARGRTLKDVQIGSGPRVQEVGKETLYEVLGLGLLQV